MPVMMIDTHKHFCPFCGKPFSCSVPFCDTIPHMVCDPCWDKPKEAGAPARTVEDVARYMREHETARG